MKIFSWVHRHFHHKDAKNADNDKVALLENEAFAASACDVWKEGILAIGTLGIHLFQDDNTKDDTFMNNQALFFGYDDDDHHDHDHDEEMECPLVRKASQHGFEFDGVEKQDLSPCEEIAKPKIGQDDDDGVKDSMKIKKHGERTTLADLLRADSEKNLLKNNELSDDHKIKVPYHDNNTGIASIKTFLISKKKKKTKLLKDDSAQPINKTKELIRKMLKKKIHPDINGNQKKKEAASSINQEMEVHAT